MQLFDYSFIILKHIQIISKDIDAKSPIDFFLGQSVQIAIG